MSQLPVAHAFGTDDVVEMQPLPAPSDIHNYSSEATVEHVLGANTDAVWIHIPAGSQLYVFAGAAADGDVDHALPLPGGLWPFAVTPGSTVTCIGDGDAFIFRILEAQL
jgi:hypothetical protein